MNRFSKCIATATVALLTGVTAFAQSPADVKRTQQQLKSAGYYHGSVDGVMGPETRSAMAQYQQANGHPVTNLSPMRTRPTTGQYYRSAGRSITRNYSAAGRHVGRGAKGMASRMRQGEVGSGFVEFGKGMGRGAKSVGKGTAGAAKNMYRGTKHAITH